MIQGIKLSNEALQSFLGLVASAIVSRDRADESESPGQDFRQRLLHWQERLEADRHALTAAQRIDVERLAQMLVRRIERADQYWDVLQSWPDLHDGDDL